MGARTTDPVIAAGETLTKTVHISRQEIVAFAQMSHDENPLHSDSPAAQRGRFGEIIASGQHTVAILMGMLATYFSRQDDGVRREMLCLNMNFSFKGPVFAERDVTLQWKVSNVEWNGKLRGLLAHLDGSATTAEGKLAVVGRGTILVKESGA
jgi:acyl dehydratase